MHNVLYVIIIFAQNVALKNVASEGSKKAFFSYYTLTCKH